MSRTLIKPPRFGGPYRLLLKTGASVAVGCELEDKDSLVRYLGKRFRTIAERNRVSNMPIKSIRNHTAMIGKYCDALMLAPGNGPLTSMLRALSAGVGSSVYQRSLERGFVNYVSFDAQMSERQTLDTEITTERQNRMLQAALLPYVERLQLLHEFSGDLSSLRNAFGNTKAGTSVHVFSNGDEEVVTEVDEDLNKQTVYIKCTPFVWPDTREGDVNIEGEFDGTVDDVEVCEADFIKATTLHAGWNTTATRIFDSLLESAPLHRSRHTVIVGYGVAGAVSSVVGMMLDNEGFVVKNTVSFGGPRVIQDTPLSVVRAINPLRVVQSGDPLVEVPVTTSEQEDFIHIGEVLMIDSATVSKDFSITGYVTAMRDMDATLAYSEGDDDLAPSK